MRRDEEAEFGMQAKAAQEFVNVLKKKDIHEIAVIKVDGKSVFCNITSLPCWTSVASSVPPSNPDKNDPLNKSPNASEKGKMPVHCPCASEANHNKTSQKNDGLELIETLTSRRKERKTRSLTRQDTVLDHCELGEHRLLTLLKNRYDGNMVEVNESECSMNISTHLGHLKLMPIQGACAAHGHRRTDNEEILNELLIFRAVKYLQHNFDLVSGFTDMLHVWIVQGPCLSTVHAILKEENNVHESSSINSSERVFIGIEESYKGCPLNKYEFQEPCQVVMTMLQVVCLLAEAETYIDFEHRYLVFENILLTPSTTEYSSYTLECGKVYVPISGIQVTLKNFTNARITFAEPTYGKVITCGRKETFFAETSKYLSNNPDIKKIVEYMREKEDWRRYDPHTNILWLCYIAENLHKKAISKFHDDSVRVLAHLPSLMKTYRSTKDLVMYLRNNLIDLHTTNSEPKTLCDRLDYLVCG